MELRKETATHSSTLAWRIPWTEEPGRLQSMGLQRVGHDLVTTTLLYYITWEIDGETVETVSDFIFLGSKITTDSDCSHEIKRRLLLGRNVMTNLDSISKSRDITLQQRSI